MAPLVYIQIIAVNVSPLLLLGSPTVNVFLGVFCSLSCLGDGTVLCCDAACLHFAAAISSDGAFVSKTALKNVHPGETFRSFLGVDVGVRVDYTDAGGRASSSGVFRCGSAEAR